MVKRLISQGTRGYLNLGEVLGRKRKLTVSHTASKLEFNPGGGVVSDDLYTGYLPQRMFY